MLLLLKLGNILLKIKHLQLKFLTEMHLSFCSWHLHEVSSSPLNLFLLEILLLFTCTSLLLAHRLECQGFFCLLDPTLYYF